MHFQGRRAERILWIVAVLSAIFIAAEFTGGLIASSLAIATGTFIRLIVKLANVLKKKKSLWNCLR